MPTTHRKTCVVPSTSATARGVPSRWTSRWVRWSRPPVRTPDAAAQPREDHERGVEDDEADDRDDREHGRGAEAGLARDRHDRRCDHEADRHAPAVTEEHPGRASEVEAQEPEAGRRDSERRHREQDVAVRDREHRRTGRADAPERPRRAVEVVHQVEGVDDADHPQRRECEVQRRGVPEDPAEIRLPQRQGDHELGEHPRQRAEADTIIRRPDQAQEGSAADDDEHVAAAAPEHERDRQRSRHHAEPPEVRGRAPVLLVAAGVVQEAGAVRQPDGQRHRQLDEARREREGEEKPDLVRQPELPPAPGRPGRHARAGSRPRSRRPRRARASSR